MNMSTAKLELFYYDSCPFCQRVLSTANQLNIKIELKDILTNTENLEKLVNDTGRRTVPCLYIDGKPMFESSDIINWLQSNVDNLEKN
jgi:glutaredoxin